MTAHELRVYTSASRDYPPCIVAIGENIARVRKAAGYKTQVAFAEALSVVADRRVPSTRVSDWENNRYRLVDTETLLMIAKVAKVSIDEVITGVDPAYDAQLQERQPHGTNIATGDPAPLAESEHGVDAPGHSPDDKTDSLSQTAAPLSPFVRELAMRIATVIHEVVAASDATVRGQAPNSRPRTPAHRPSSRRRR